MSTGEPPHRWGADYAERIEATTPEAFKGTEVHICPSGLAVLKNVNGKGFHPLGCPVCLGVKPSQNALGNPTLGGAELLYAEDVSKVPDHIGPEMRANLWLCPGCMLPVMSLMPKFDTLAYRP